MLACIARNVSRLKNSVPTSWISADHQSILPGSKVSRRSLRFACSPRSRSAFAVSRHWRSAALVKKIEPTKKTAPSAVEPTKSANPGKGPTRKQTEPIENKTPIHHEARRGAHQTEPPARGAVRGSRSG
jgi:hypothetical protein